MQDGAKLVGVCNVTPDSFSGDGWLRDANEYQNSQVKNNLRRELESLIVQGADIVDIGAESTAPGSVPITVEEEKSRLEVVMGVVRQLIEAKKETGSGVEFSIDTVNSSTAEHAVSNGFTIVNDVSGGRNDPKMFPFIASRPSVKYILMYCKNASGRADLLDTQTDVYPKILSFFDKQIQAAVDSGVARSQLILDPGMGAFISTHAKDSVEVLKRIPEIKRKFGLPVLIGASRKGFLTSLVKRDFGAHNRVGVSIAAALYAAQQGAGYLRVHDVMQTKQFLEAHRSLFAEGGPVLYGEK